jgi:4,5-DOPA dioxygenase extradiol
MNAVRQNPYTQAWAAIGKSMPRPRAVLCVSAHWFVPGSHVTAMERPRTIHDFGGFPRALQEVLYPAPGDPGLARRVQQVLAPVPVTLDTRWGLDHGTWSVLVHMFPNADVPVIQLSIDETQMPAFHFDLGRRLATLRDEGVLIVGSGNVVHNLEAYAWGAHTAKPLPWAARFDYRSHELLANNLFKPLIDYESLGEDALLSVPTPEHFLPLLYVAGARKDGETARFPIAGFDGGSISMLCVQFGDA